MRRRQVENRRRFNKTRIKGRRFTMQLHSTASAGNIQFSATPRFKRPIGPFANAVGLVALAGLSLSSVLAASNDQELQASNGHQVCNRTTLQGRYLFAESGVLLPPAFGVATPTQGADAGVHILNGDGSGTDTVTFRVGGSVVLENVVSPLTYTVNEDCTGTITVINGPSFDIFVAPDGSGFAAIATAPSGNYPAAIDRRVSSK
jgi:hypothetical protein